MKLLFTLTIAFLSQRTSALDKVVCYYQSWASYSGINPEDLDPNLCTHINYAFMELWDDGNVKVGDDELAINQGLYYRTTDLKQRNPNLKVLLSVGGAGVDPNIFARMAADSGKRGAFIGSATHFIETYHFDGLDIDWEAPQGGDRGNYITLLRELRNAFDQRGWLLTAAVSANIGDGYDVPEMNNLLDFINVMSYDFYGSWSSYTGQNSPLYASSVESDWEKANLNLAASGEQWKNAGASPEKIVMGVAFYGRSFTLADSNQNGIHAPIKGTGVGENGYVEYSEICSTYGDWHRNWDDEQKNPIKVNGDQWIGYDDADSISIKMWYIKTQNYGGVMMWPVDGDDVKGKCGENQPLLKAINNNR